MMTLGELARSIVPPCDMQIFVHEEGAFGSPLFQGNVIGVQINPLLEGLKVRLVKVFASDLLWVSVDIPDRESTKPALPR